MDKYIVLSVFPAKNEVDHLARVRSEDPTETSFIAMIPRSVAVKLDQIREGAVVALRKLDGLNLPAIVDVFGLMPMPLQLPTPIPQEQVEWSGPEEIVTMSQVVSQLEVMQKQMLRLLSLLR